MTRLGTKFSWLGENVFKGLPDGKKNPKREPFMASTCQKASLLHLVESSACSCCCSSLLPPTLAHHVFSFRYTSSLKMVNVSKSESKISGIVGTKKKHVLDSDLSSEPHNLLVLTRSCSLSHTPTHPKYCHPICKAIDLFYRASVRISKSGACWHSRNALYKCLFVCLFFTGRHQTEPICEIQNKVRVAAIFSYPIMSSSASMCVYTTLRMLLLFNHCRA